MQHGVPHLCAGNIQYQRHDVRLPKFCHFTKCKSITQVICCMSYSVVPRQDRLASTASPLPLRKQSAYSGFVFPEGNQNDLFVGLEDFCFRWGGTHVLA